MYGRHYFTILQCIEGGFVDHQSGTCNTSLSVTKFISVIVIIFVALKAIAKQVPILLNKLFRQNYREYARKKLTKFLS